MTRKTVSISAVVASVPLLVGAWIQFDRWRVEKARMELQMQFEAELRACTEMGGNWHRGDCSFAP